MGSHRRWFQWSKRRPDASNAETADGRAFAVGWESVPREVFGVKATHGVSAGYVEPPVGREQALSVPAVKRARDLIAGTLGGIPLQVFGADRQRLAWSVLEQPERGRPRSVTMTETYEDLLLYKHAWWRVVERGWHGYPTFVERLDPKRVHIDAEQRRVYVDGVLADDANLIHFESPAEGLLKAGARAIRTCLALEAASRRNADEPLPTSYLTPTDTSYIPDDDEVTEILDSWAKARRTRATGWVPNGVDLKTAGWSPEQMQMGDSRQHAVLEIARLTGVDAEALNVAISSRTYFNSYDRRKQFVDFVLSMYRQALEERLAMGDVTPRGYYAKHNMDAFLRGSTLERYQTYEVGLRVGALTPDDIAALEDKPPASPAVRASSTPTTNGAPPMAADTPARVAFADAGLTFDAPLDGSRRFAVDTAKRTITGVVVPYGVAAQAGGWGPYWRFSKGSLTWSDVSRVKFWVDHDPSRAFGVAVELEDTDDALLGTFKIARGAEGDKYLALAEDGVYDGLSLQTRGEPAYVVDEAGVYDVVSGALLEVSLTSAPAFDGSRVTSVAASAVAAPNERKKSSMEPEDLKTLTETMTAAIGAGFAALNQPPAAAPGTAGATFSAPEVVPAITTGGRVEVTEQPLYRFDGHRAQRCFTTDLRDANQGDSEARRRVETFMGEAFAVTPANVAALNPATHRPDLYVPQLPYARPLWESVTTGNVDDGTPFTIPKFATATGLVSNHATGVEPTPGGFTATSQTITPAPKSGKIEVNREVLDAGGSPQADQIIWGEMLNGWYEALETMIATELNASATPELNLAGAVDGALVSALTAYFAGLQFVRGGNRFTGFVSDGQLYPALVGAKDGQGRNLLPVLGATNAQGETTGAFDSVMVGSTQVRPAWALGTAATSKSYSFVPSSVYAWASNPQRFTFEYQVKSVDIAIWGWGATGITRATDVKPIDYTTADA